MRRRDRESAKGLLPRMEARPRKDGLTTYRYHPVGSSPINLGTDRVAACRRVLDMLGVADDTGTIARLWDHYRESPYWHALKPRTRSDYEAYSVHILRVFGKALASDIDAPAVARYLRKERSDAPVRANREIALLGNLIGLAIERGEATANPCRGGLVRRNMERPRDTLPEVEAIQALIEFAKAKDAAVKTGIGRATVIMLAAEFAALTGARQAEFLPLHWPAFGDEEVRLNRAKQRMGTKKVDRIAVSPALAELRERLLAYQTSAMGPVFPNQDGNVYTASGFATMWQRLMVAALAAGRVKARFNFHALRAFYATEHKASTGSLPDMHASPTTTAKVYERSKAAKRKAL
jgi:integrase